MTRYTISNQTSGLVLGTYTADSEQGALDAMAREAGYADYAEAQRVAPAQDGEIVVSAVDVPTIASLDELADLLRNAPEADNTCAQSDYADLVGLPRRMGAIDWSSLPTFGGAEPRDTTGVWSWDATRLLVGTCAEDIEIVDREGR